jgi:hypothetical protein
MAFDSARRGSSAGLRTGRARAIARVLIPLIALTPIAVTGGLASRSALAQGDALNDPTEQAEEASGPSATAQFTTAVENREPVDQVTFVPNEARQISFFSELQGLGGRTVTHRWSYQGEIVAEVPFDVGGPRWRVWSTKDLKPDWIGDWTVEIVLDDGEVIGAETFTYSAPED